MSQTTPLFDRPLTEVESEEFRALELTPGHWSALAPIPLYRNDLNSPHPQDLPTLAKLQQQLRGDSHRPLDPVRSAEAELLWKKMCSRSITAEAAERANSLLAWYLAIYLPRQERESYLGVLDGAAAKFLKSLRAPAANALPSYSLRQRIERYLPHPTFTRYPAEPRLVPPDSRQVAKCFGADLWKQMLVAPIAAALGESQARPAAVFSVAEVLAHVTLPNAYNKPYPLEPHLVAGSWRRLFEGLFNPQRKEETEPLVRQGLEIAAHGLASMSFAERESLLNVIHEQIERGIDRTDLKRILADEWIDRMRNIVEDYLRQAPPVSEPPPPPPPRGVSGILPTPASGTVAARQAMILEPGAALASQTDPRPATVHSPASPLPRAMVSPPMPSTPPIAVASVERAEPFALVTWEESLARVAKISLAEILAWLRKPGLHEMLFDDQRSECPEVAIVRDAKRVPAVLWMVGDLHADVLTLTNIIAHAERLTASGSEPPAFIFLGDFVDRGIHDHETLLLLFRLIVENPGRVCVIPGNHDIDLQWDQKLNRFRVSIEPAEYCEHLNEMLRSGDPQEQDQVEFAKLLITFWQTRPKAVILPDGTLLSHGGFPHTDMQASLQTPADLARPNCLNDFLWARLAETARKRPNRGNRGHEFGWETFAQFCKVSAQMGLPPIKRFIRGHDHVPRRWQSYPDYAEFPVLTINAMGRRMEGESESGDGPHPFPVIARYIPDQLPAVVKLPLDPKEVDRAFGRETPPRKEEEKKLDSSLTTGPVEQNGPVEQIPPHGGSEPLNEIVCGVPLNPPKNTTPKPSSDAEK